MKLTPVQEAAFKPVVAQLLQAQRAFQTALALLGVDPAQFAAYDAETATIKLKAAPSGPDNAGSD